MPPDHARDIAGFRGCRRLAATAVLVLGASLSACSDDKPSFALPDRADPAVRAEEARVAAVLAADTSGRLLSRPLQGRPECAVRLLREDGATDYVFARCTAGPEGLVAPVKVTGTVVTVPDDGAGYTASLKRLFPADIAAALIADDRRYAP